MALVQWSKNIRIKSALLSYARVLQSYPLLMFMIRLNKKPVREGITEKSNIRSGEFSSNARMRSMRALMKKIIN